MLPLVAVFLATVAATSFAARPPPRLTARGAVAAAPAAPSPHDFGAAGLNAKDFGAVGDGVADDAAALTAAIDAATAQGRTLLLPAGTYRVNSTVSVPPTGGCECTDCACWVDKNHTVRRRPLRLVGEGNAITSILCACPSPHPTPPHPSPHPTSMLARRAGQPMHAVLNITSLSGPTEGAAAPVPYEGLYLGDVGIQSNKLANFSLFAPGIARSRFERLDVGGASVAGMSIGYGALPCLPLAPPAPPAPPPPAAAAAAAAAKRQLPACPQAGATISRAAASAATSSPSTLTTPPTTVRARAVLCSGNAARCAALLFDSR